MNNSLHAGKESNLANCSGCHLNALPSAMDVSIKAILYRGTEEVFSKECC